MSTDFAKAVVKEYEWLTEPQKLLGEVDWLFANTLSNSNSKRPNFVLAYLFFAARRGFLSLSIDAQKLSVQPDFSELLIALEPAAEQKLKKLFWEDWQKLSFDHITDHPSEEIPLKPVVWEDHKLFLQKNYIYQKQIIKHLKRLDSSPPTDLFQRSLLDRLASLPKNLSQQQKLAIQNAFEHNLTIIWGGPGTGKTFTAAVFADLFSIDAINPPKILALAPTGKAALHLKKTIEQKLTSTVEMIGMTIHAALQLNPKKDPLFGKQRKLKADLIIVDETSMIDARLMAYLLDAIDERTRLVFLGDPDQLPPVENVDLSTFFQPFALKTIFLKENYRFKNEAFQKTLSALRKKDKAAFIQTLDNFSIVKPELVFQAQNSIVEKVFQTYNKLFSGKTDPEELLECLESFRLLSALKVGPLGTHSLNEKIWECFRLQKTEFPFPIVITQNDYQQNLFNGEIGFFFNKAAYFRDEEQKSINGNSIKRVPAYLLPSYNLGYALSVHKSQGSEYQEICLVLPEKSEVFGLKLLYTAITRAKTKASLFAFEKTLDRMFEN